MKDENSAEGSECPYCGPDGTIWNGDGSKICPHCNGSHIVKTPQPEEKKDEHCELPNGNYKYGEPYASGVRPVYGAHQQLLWYSVPGKETRFTILKEAEDYHFIKLELAELRAERDDLHLVMDKAEEQVQLFSDTINNLKAENERLKGELEDYKSFAKRNKWFNSELQRRWPSEEEFNKKLDDYGFVVPYDGSNNFYDEERMRHFREGILWLKSYLENK